MYWILDVDGLYYSEKLDFGFWILGYDCFFIQYDVCFCWIGGCFDDCWVYL